MLLKLKANNLFVLFQRTNKVLTLFNNKDYEVMFVTGKNYYDE